jgi:hypothetical protein
MFQSTESKMIEKQEEDENVLRVRSEALAALSNFSFAEESALLPAPTKEQRDR